MGRTYRLYQAGEKMATINWRKLLAQNAEFKIGPALKIFETHKKRHSVCIAHCLPADISGLSCKEGEVENSVFERYINPLNKQASYKP
jgi:ornithine carbamoyltransferase